MLRHHPLAPFVAIFMAIALFSMMDVLMKGLSLTIGAYNATLWRNIGGAMLTGTVWAATHGRWPGAAVLRIHALRSLVVTFMALSFFWALAHLPLAEAIALSFIAPVIALYLAGWLLGEEIRPSAKLASLLGLAGTAVILSGRLSGGYDAKALLGAAAVLFSACLYAWNLVLARQQAQLSQPLEITFFQCLFVSLFLLPAAPWLADVPTTHYWLPIAGTTLLALTSLLLVSWAYARAEAQALIPVEYTAFLWAMLFGWLFFAEPVSLTVLAGAVLIAAGSLIAARMQAEGREPVDHVETTAL